MGLTIVLTVSYQKRKKKDQNQGQILIRGSRKCRAFKCQQKQTESRQDYQN